jgi:predicted nucleic acid-binding protein
MNARRGLVLDANILMRALLGRRVRELLERYEDSAPFTALTSALMTPVIICRRFSKSAGSTWNPASPFSNR